MHSFHVTYILLQTLLIVRNALQQFVISIRHSEIHDLKAATLSAVCKRCVD